MGTIVTGIYNGDLSCIVSHDDSGANFRTVAPKDNEGDGSSFSPTDLVGTALGSCIVTTMGIIAKKKGIDITGTTMHVVKEMSSDPRRIGSLKVSIHMPKRLEEKDRERLEAYGLSCPVKKSLHPEVSVEIEFVYDLT